MFGKEICFYGRNISGKLELYKVIRILFILVKESCN